MSVRESVKEPNEMADENISESTNQKLGKDVGKKAGKIFIQTHGCQMNEYDSAKMADVLNDANGMELTDNAEEADVLLLNTCSIREKAQEKSFPSIGPLAKN